MALQRAMLPNGTAANMPLICWNAIPYGYTDGIQMHREVVAELAADPTQGVVVGNPMTADSNRLDFERRASRRHQQCAVRAPGRAGCGASTACPWPRRHFSAIPSGIPSVGGPRIAHAYRQDNSTIVLTIAHDAGNDLQLPGLAAVGQGFLVMDGGSVASPGTLRPATACVLIDTTHLRLTLASPLTIQARTACCSILTAPSARPACRATRLTWAWVTRYMTTLRRLCHQRDGISAPTSGAVGGLNFPLAATAAPIILSDTIG